MFLNRHTFVLLKMYERTICFNIPVCVWNLKNTDGIKDNLIQFLKFEEQKYCEERVLKIASGHTNDLNACL